MELRIPSSLVPPDLRFAAAPALARPGHLSLRLSAGAELRATTTLPRPLSIPAYLLYADHDAVLVASGVTTHTELFELLAGSLAEERQQQHASLGQTVCALGVVDEVFRSTGLWQGNIYLAGYRSLHALGLVLSWPLSIGSAATDTAAAAEQVLRELHALELIYMFPVAAKFRGGGYDGDVQFRLNGWGRALASRLPWPLTSAAYTRARDTLRTHLDENRAAYTRHLGSFELSRQTYASDLFAAAQMLPIPVLV